MWLSAVSRRGKFFSSSFTGIVSFKCQEPSGLDQQEVFVVQRRESQSVLIFIIVNSRDQNSFNILLFFKFSTFSAISYKLPISRRDCRYLRHLFEVRYINRGLLLFPLDHF